MIDGRSKARGRECFIRLPGVCNHDPETVVFCHYRMIGITGMGYKSGSHWLGAFGCSSCHQRVDTDKSPEVQLAFAQAVFRTQATLLREGKIHE